jgi:hypothetical protein
MARRFIEEALAAWREIGSVVGVTFALGDLGDLARAQGELVVARERYVEALRTGRDRGARAFLGLVRYALRKLGGLSVAAGDPVRAARIFGAEATARGAASSPAEWPSERYGDDLAAARAALGEAAFAAAWAEGAAMTLDEAIAYALSDAPEEDARTPSGSADATASQPT